MKSTKSLILTYILLTVSFIVFYTIYSNSFRQQQNAIHETAQKQMEDSGLNDGQITSIVWMISDSVSNTYFSLSYFFTIIFCLLAAVCVGTSSRIVNLEKELEIVKEKLKQNENA